MQQPTLKRSLSLTLLVFYGLGTTIGAGIYVLIGKVAGQAGYFAPLSFLLAALVATPTALAFGELAARYPKSAGEAVYAEEAFGLRHFSRAVGLAVVCVGLVSSAAIVAGAVGYLQNIVAIPIWAGLILIVAVLGLVAVWGISESVAVTAVATLLEIGGLVLIIWLGREAFTFAWPSENFSTAPALSEIGTAGILSGAVLAFYAFVGFEDMVNVSEEVRAPSRTMPRAIALTLAITAVLYVLVSWVAVGSMPVDALAASTAPMSDIFRKLTGLPHYTFDAMVVAAVTNGALVQIIMASRVLYGLARENWLPRILANLSTRTRTPYVATVAASFGVFILAMMFPVEALARATSFVTLLIFAVVNVSLLRVRQRPAEGLATRPLPALVPALGFVLSIALAGFQVVHLIFGSARF